MSYQTEQKLFPTPFSSHGVFLGMQLPDGEADIPPGVGDPSKGVLPVLYWTGVWWGRTKLCEMWTQLSAQLSGSIWVTRTAGCVYFVEYLDLDFLSSNKRRMWAPHC